MWEDGAMALMYLQEEIPFTQSPIPPFSEPRGTGWLKRLTHTSIIIITMMTVQVMWWAGIKGRPDYPTSLTHAMTNACRRSLKIKVKNATSPLHLSLCGVSSSPDPAPHWECDPWPAAAQSSWRGPVLKYSFPHGNFWRAQIMTCPWALRRHWRKRKGLKRERERKEKHAEAQRYLDSDRARWIKKNREEPSNTEIQSKG